VLDSALSFQPLNLLILFLSFSFLNQLHNIANIPKRSVSLAAIAGDMRIAELIRARLYDADHVGGALLAVRFLGHDASKAKL